MCGFYVSILAAICLTRAGNVRMMNVFINLIGKRRFVYPKTSPLIFGKNDVIKD
jgi:hypothetical protein